MKKKCNAPKLNTDMRAKNRHQFPSITAVDIDKGGRGGGGGAAANNRGKLKH